MGVDVGKGFGRLCLGCWWCLCSFLMFFVVFRCSPVCLFHGRVGGLGFCMVIVLLVLLRVPLGLAFDFDGLLDELMVSVVVVVQVLGSPVQGVRGGHFAVFFLSVFV